MTAVAFVLSLSLLSQLTDDPRVRVCPFTATTAGGFVDEDLKARRDAVQDIREALATVNGSGRAAVPAAVRVE